MQCDDNTFACIVRSLSDVRAKTSGRHCLDARASLAEDVLTDQDIDQSVTPFLVIPLFKRLFVTMNTGQKLAGHCFFHKDHTWMSFNSSCWWAVPHLASISMRVTCRQSISKMPIWILDHIWTFPCKRKWVNLIATATCRANMWHSSEIFWFLKW